MKKIKREIKEYLMKKIIALGVTALLSFGVINAQDDHSQSVQSSFKNPKPHPQTEDSKDLGIYASYLFWQLGSYNTFYQMTCEDADTATTYLNNLYPEGGTYFARTDSKSRSGFNVGFEHLSERFDKWTVGVQYQWIRHNITTVDCNCNPSSACGSNCDDGWAWWGAGSWIGQAQFGLAQSENGSGSDFFIQEVRAEDEHFPGNKSFAIDEIQFAKNKTTWQSVDLTFAKAMDVNNSKRISLEPKMGLEFNWFKMETYLNGRYFERNNGISLSNIQATITPFSDYERDYFQWCMVDKPWAIGPFAGANLALRLCNEPYALSLFGNFKLSQLYTKHKFRLSYSESLDAVTENNCEPSCSTSCCGPTDAFDTTTLHTNTKIGIQYTNGVPNRSINFDMSVAWELNNFINFFDAVHAWPWSGDLAYQGLTVTVGVYF